MAEKRRPARGSKPGRAPAGGEKPSPDKPRADEPARRLRPALVLRKKGAAGEHELVQPRCAQQRAEDMAEVREMIEGGEIDIAIDELRWLLSGCPEMIEAHQLLGELALADGDFRLARGHYGYAYDLGLAATRGTSWRGTLPHRLAGNRAFLVAAKGLALCFFELGERERAREIAARLIAFDPSDPLEARAWLASWPSEPESPSTDQPTP